MSDESDALEGQVEQVEFERLALRTRTEAAENERDRFKELFRGEVKHNQFLSEALDHKRKMVARLLNQWDALKARVAELEGALENAEKADTDLDKLFQQVVRERGALRSRVQVLEGALRDEVRAMRYRGQEPSEATNAALAPPGPASGECVHGRTGYCKTCMNESGVAHVTAPPEAQPPAEARKECQHEKRVHFHEDGSMECFDCGAQPAQGIAGERCLGTFDPEWCKWAAELEAGLDVTAGRPDAQPAQGGPTMADLENVASPEVREQRRKAGEELLRGLGTPRGAIQTVDLKMWNEPGWAGVIETARNLQTPAGPYVIGGEVEPDTLPTLSVRQVEKAMDRVTLMATWKDMTPAGVFFYFRSALGLTPPAKVQP